MTTLDRLKRYVEELPERNPIIRRALSDLGPADEVDAAINALVAEGVLMRATEGVFGKPHTSEFGTWVGFGAWETAKAICENEGLAIGLTPIEWANTVHLSTQVVAKPTYITDGPSREVVLEDGTTIEFTHASPRDIRLAQTLGAGAVLGLEWAHPAFPLIAVRQLARDLSPEGFSAFLQEGKGVGGWVARVADAFENALGNGDDGSFFDLGDRSARRGIVRGFSETFLGHERRCEAGAEALNRYLAPKGDSGNGESHEG